MSLAVVLCTHAPRPDLIGRTLAALRGQTLPLDRWDLLIVDNASPQPLAATLDLGWHPRARVVREDEPGILAARRRGIREAATHEWIVWCDDDNLLDPDYLEQVVRIAAERPDVAIFGGRLVPEFETVPEEWTRPFWCYLALSDFRGERFARGPLDFEGLPPTAGMAMRRDAGTLWLEALRRDPRHERRGPGGRPPHRGEDTHLAWSALEAGLAVGRFDRLRLVHLMPARRLEEGNLRRIFADTMRATDVLRGLCGIPAPEPSWPALVREWLRAIRLPRRERRFYVAELWARSRARADLRRLGPPPERRG